MVKNSKGIVCTALVLVFFMAFFSGCEKKIENIPDTAKDKMTFRDIPGITQYEKNAIDALREKYGSSGFVYGINLTTEAFMGKNGEINGYAVMFCEWLSELFGIKFTPKYYQWGDLLRGLEADEVDFTGELMATSEGKPGYHMSSPTINRTIRTYRLRNSIPITEILRTRQPRYAFLSEAVVADDVDANIQYDIESFIVDSHQEAYRALKSGEADAFIGMDTAEGAFDVYSDVESEEFYPLIFRSSCLSTYKDEFRPIINALDKAMNDQVLEHLTELQKKGYRQYMENRIYSLLTEEELAYIKNHPEVPIGADFSNYPISFYNTHTNKWEGIYFEALDEVEKLTGLKFVPANDENMPLLNVIDNVEKGDMLILPELFQIKEYEGRFLWSEIPFVTDNFSIISKSDFRNIDINEIFHLHVGIRKETIYSEMFRRVFPAHRNFTEYETMEETWEALRRGDVDVIFASRRRLVIYTNYYEQADFKLNLVFNHTFNSYLAYNKDSAILRSIVDKAMRFVNIDNMTNQWIYKNYDYRSKMAAAQRPWLIGAAVLFFTVLLLVLTLLKKSHSTGRVLEQLVEHRTSALAFETSKLQTMIDSIPDLMFCKNTDFQYIQCNRSFEQFMGINEEDILKKTDKEGTWLSPEQVDRIHIIEQAVINENRLVTLEEKVRSPITGKECIFETVKAPMRQDGAVVGLIAIVRDITQRKKTESELSFKTSQLKMIIDSIPDGMFCKDIDLKYIQCNKVFESFTGVREENILGKSDVEEGSWLTPDAIEKIHCIERTVIDEGRSFTFEETVPLVTGKEIIFETSKAPITQDGAVVGLIAIVRDITLRKKTEKELSFKTSQLKMIIDSIPDSMFCKDIDLKYIQCNNVFETFMGVREEYILGKSDQDGNWLSPEAIERIYRIERAVIDEGRSFTFEETVHSPVTGKESVFETIKAPIIQDGAVVGLIAIIRDISQRKDMEKELALQTSLFKTMLSSLPDAVFCKDLNFKYTLCNNYMADVFGKNVEEIIGKNDTDALGLHPETAAIAFETDKKIINEKKQVSYEEWIHCADGVTRLFETVKTPLILDNEIIGIMAIGRDITRRKEMEEEARAASTAKSSFLANMSHELRTPLNVVIGLTELILEEKMTKQIRSNLIKISNAGTTLLSIVNDILDFSKIESGKLTLSPVEYYTASLLNDIITLVITRLGEKPVMFHLNIKDDLPNKLNGDDLRVKQIFTNLLTNAIKYTHEGSINLSISCSREGGAVWMDVAVSDTGMGIPKDDIKNLFLDYYQVAANAARNIEGTGLGLPITKRLVEMMDGQISVESREGKGSTFYFRIKQGFVSDMTLGAEVSEKLRTFCYSDDKRVVSRKLVRVNLSYARVLVVDDMQTNLDVASGILRKYQMQVDVLSNGPATINRIREGKPVYNAIFMDHMMPGMDGIETVDRIRALDTEYAKKIPIIALTANAIQGTDKMFFAHDFQAFITKPIDIMEIDSVLRKWVYDSKHANEIVSGELDKDESFEDEDITIEITGVDSEKGLSLYAGEMDIYIPLLRSYVTNTPMALSKLRAVSAQNLSDYVITVHGLKGTSAGIGAEQIREAALELENKSRAGDLQGVLEKNDKLIADTQVVVANITAWLKEYDSKNVKPRMKAPDRELLAKMKECCDNYDMNGIDEVIAELGKNDYEEDSSLVAWLKEKIDISEIDEAAARLAEVLGK